MKSPMRDQRALENLSPQLAVTADAPPAGSEWLHEIKFDGYRIIAVTKPGAVRLLSRNGRDWTERFSAVAEALEKLRARDAILDGEIVAFDQEGRSNFQALQNYLRARRGTGLCYMVFDLLSLNGKDLRSAVLIERKKALQRLLKASTFDSRVRFSDHVIGSGPEFYEQACARALEGIVSKRIDSHYVNRRSAAWLKCKCSGREEFVIVGFTLHSKLPRTIGALLLGAAGAGGGLVYCGKVGTGFGSEERRSLFETLSGLEVSKSPLSARVPVSIRRSATWVRPRLLAEIRFSERTRDGILRQPSFLGLRQDKHFGGSRQRKKSATR